MRKNLITLNKPVLAAAIPVCLIAAGSLLFFGMRTPSEDSTCQDTVARLQQLESADISGLEEQLKALRPQSTALTEGTEGQESAILSDVDIRQVFQGSVILGDSITNSIVEYGFLDTDVVVAQLGLCIAAADSHIETAIALQPSHVFMAFGSNDLETYISDSAAFIDAYRIQVKKLQDALPGVPIYINGILPILPSAIESIPALGYYGDYNEALKAFCEETGCIYIDNSFIVENNESMYEPDGEHVVMNYYPKWLTNMAKTAGLC